MSHVANRESWNSVGNFLDMVRFFCLSISMLITSPAICSAAKVSPQNPLVYHPWVKKPFFWRRDPDLFRTGGTLHYLSPASFFGLISPHTPVSCSSPASHHFSSASDSCVPSLLSIWISLPPPISDPFLSHTSFFIWLWSYNV